MGDAKISLKILLPELFAQPERALDDGVVLVDAAVRHYSEELRQSLGTNEDVVSNVQEISDKILQDLQNINNEIVSLSHAVNDEKIGLYVSSHNRLEDTNSLLQEITETQEGIQAIDVLREVLLFCENLSDIIVPKGGLVVAVRGCKEMRKHMRSLASFFDEDDPDIERIQIALNKSHSTILESIMTTLERIVRFDASPNDPLQTALVVNDTSTDSQTSLLDVLSALSVLSPLDQLSALRDFGKHLHERIVEPVLDNPDLFLRWEPSSNRLRSVREKERSELPMVQQNCIRVCVSLCCLCEFLSSTVFPSHPHLLQSIGFEFWPLVKPKVLSKVLGPAIPCSLIEIETLGPAQHAVEKLQRCLQVNHLIAATDRSLGTFFNNVEAKFGTNLRDRVLKEVQKLLDDESYEISRDEDYGKIRMLYPFVSERACTLHSKVNAEFRREENISFSSRAHTISLLLHALAEGAEHDNSLSSVCVDAVFYYTAVAPFVSQRRERVHLVQLFLFTDSMLLAKHAAFLARSYSGLGPLLHTVPRLVRVATEALQSQQRQLFHNCDVSMQHLDELSKINRKSDYDSHILELTKLVRSWEHFGKVAKDILPERIVWKFVASLCEEVMSLLSRWTLNRVDIPLECANRTFAVFNIINDFHESVLAAALTGQAENLSYKRSRQLFVVIHQVLHPDQSLFNLHKELKNGNLSAFSKPQLCSLIKALFEETVNRSKFLNAVEQTEVEMRDPTT